MKYRVVIRAFTLRRDVANALVLAKVLERFGCEVFVACTRNFNWVVKYWRPHAVVLNTVGRVKITRQLAPDALIFHQPAEGSERIECSDASMFARHPRAFDEVAGVFVWGEVPLGYYEQRLPGCDGSKLHLCGNPRLDMLKFNPDLKGNRKNSNSIGIVGRFEEINSYRSEPTSDRLVKPHKLDYVVRQCIGFHSTMRLCERLLEETDYRINLRPYPLEAPESYHMAPKKRLGDRFDIDDSLDFAAWASRQRFIVSQISTTFIEPYLLGIPLISLDRIIDSYGFRSDLDGYVSQDASDLPTTIDEALEIVKRGPPDVSPRKKSVDKALEECHGYYIKGSGLKRSAEVILDRLEGTRFAFRPRLPRFGVEIRDWLSFKRTTFGDPQHVNFSYKSGYHEVPAYFDRIVDNIFAADSQ